jgi:DNA-binding transcriptional LysR family regulator
MTNVPTDLLRTLVAVVELRSYTRAATSLGITQPAVSAQIKRLQILLGKELFARGTHGLGLTPHGQLVLEQARQLLSLNDEIVAAGRRSLPTEEVVRIGTPSDFVASVLPETLASFRERHPNVRFIVRSDFSAPLVRQLYGGEIDILFHLTLNRSRDARHCQEQEVVWVRGKSSVRLDLAQPIPLVANSNASIYNQLAVNTLRNAGLDCEQVFTGPSMHSRRNAVAAGLGVMLFTRRRANAVGLTPWDDGPLPKPKPLYSSVHVREGSARELYEQLADEMAAVIHGPPDRQAQMYSALDRLRRASSAA